MRVMVADDAVLFREGLSRVLAEAGFEVTAKVADGQALLHRVREDPPDVCVVDIRMPPTHTTEGLDTARALRGSHPGVGVLVLSAHTEPEYALALIEGEAQGAGYLLKERVADLAEFTDAVRRVAMGGLVIDPSVVAQLVGRRRAHNPLDALTDREREVLSVMAEGRSNQAICEPALPESEDFGGLRPRGVHQARPAPGRRRQSPRAGRAGFPARVKGEHRRKIEAAGRC